MKRKYLLTSGINVMSAVPVDGRQKNNKQTAAGRNDEQNFKGEQR